MTPEDIAYLRQQAQARGYSADDLLKAINYESSGREGVWGGKGGNYFGLIQFGPNERKTYGVDTQNPTARNQIDATMRFLADRGFKPGMPLLDLYSTINAGSPGHYKASDGNGTVASHVAKMMGMPVPQGATQQPGLSPLSGLPSDALSFSATTPAASPKADPIADLLAMGGVEQKPKANLTQFVGSLLAEPDTAPQPKQASSTNDEFLQQMMDLHRAQHQRAIQGLL